MDSLKHIKRFNEMIENSSLNDEEVFKYLNNKYSIKDNLMVVGKFDRYKKYNQADISNDISKKFELDQYQSLDLVEKWMDTKFNVLMKKRF